MPFGKENDIAIITRDYNATPEQAEHLFSQMWTYTYGLCVLCARKVCNFTEDEITKRLGEIFAGMIYLLKKTRRAALKTIAKIPIYPKARLTKYIAATDEVNLCRKL